MKYLLVIIGILFYAPFLNAQKTVFTTNQEKARFEKHTQQIKITHSTYKIKSGLIEDSLKTQIIDLMSSKPGFVSVDFINDQTVIVEHQENLTDELVVKNLNRQGKIFILQKPKEFIQRE